MEKNLHDDRLDDYVKGSFDDYIENPATDMWERIAGELPPAEDPKPVWYAWRGYRWQLVAATVILLLVTRLVCVQYYYEDKIRLMSGQHEQANQNGPSIQPLMPTVPENHSLVPSPESATTPERIERASNQNIPATETQVPAIANQNTSATKTKDPVFPNQHTPATVATETDKKSVLTVMPQGLESSKTENVPVVALPLAGTNQQQEGATISANSIRAEAVSTPKISDFKTIDPKFPSLTFTRTENPSAVTIPTKKFREASGWYLGFLVTPHLTVEKAQTPTRPGPIMHPRRLFIAQQERPQPSADVSLRVGKKLNSRFAIESGIGFQNFTRTASHRAFFEYQEGQTIQNPSGAESRSFDYDLNTYGGSASVSLQMEVRGSDTPTAQERVGAIITSKESIKMVQIPVLGVARLGVGRLQAVVKAGILGSYLTKNSLEITAYSVENDKLRFRNNGGYTVAFNRPDHFIWGYQFSAGAEFRLSKNLSLAAAPTLSGDFQRKVSGLGKLPGHALVGVSLGANWWF